MKVIPKHYVGDPDSYERISPYFNTHKRAIAWIRKHHVFGVVLDIKEDEIKKFSKSLDK